MPADGGSNELGGEQDGETTGHIAAAFGAVGAVAGEPAVSFGAVIVGDEIIRGKRQDRHFGKVIEVLGARGLELNWCIYLSDDRQRLTEFFSHSMHGDEIVFCFGGIGITPDDHTRQAVAAAMGVELELHADAKREIESRFGDQTTPQRLMLGEFPQGSRIIPNPFNRIPGFAVRTHHFFPGFPEMAWPMMAWVLDTWYLRLHHQNPWEERAVVVYSGSESALLDLMRQIEHDYKGAKVFSLPSFGGEGVRQHIELGVRGDADAVSAAIVHMRAELSLRGLEWEDRA